MAHHVFQRGRAVLQDWPILLLFLAFAALAVVKVPHHLLHARDSPNFETGERRSLNQWTVVNADLHAYPPSRVRTLS
jgi:hypothetical protein